MRTGIAGGAWYERQVGPAELEPLRHGGNPRLGITLALPDSLRGPLFRLLDGDAEFHA